MSDLKIDNLKPEATASEMEQAILALQSEQADVKEAVEPEATEEKGQKIEAKDTTPPVEKEITEDKDDFDYKKGYEGIRSWQTKLAQDIADLKRSFQDKAPEKEQPEQGTKVTQSDWDLWHSQDPAAANAWLTQQNLKPVESGLKGLEAKVNSVLAKESIGRFRSTYDDFDAMKDDIFKEFSIFPKEMLDNPEYFDSILDTSYWTAKGRKIKDQEAKIRADERAQLELKQRTKKEIYVEGPAKGAIEERLDTSKLSSDELMKLMRAQGVVRDL